MAMRTGVSVASVILGSAMLLVVCVAGVVPANSLLDVSPAAISPTAPPDAYMYFVVGYTFDADGVTPLPGCNIVITNVNTSESASTVSYSSYAFYMYDLGAVPLVWEYGDIINVTATKGALIGWNEAPIMPGPYVMINVTLSSPQASFALRLVQGWNFVSVPLVDCHYTASTLGLAYGDVVVGWNSSRGVYDQAFFVGISPPSHDFDVLPGRGYEVYSATDRELTLRGTAPMGEQSREVVVPKGGGWVTVGFLGFNTTRRASDVPGLYSAQGCIPTVIAYDAATGRYIPYFTIAPSTDFTLTVGQAFWVWCSESGVLSYNP